MSSEPKRLNRLLQLARRAKASPAAPVENSANAIAIANADAQGNANSAATAPFGFATRVAGRWAATPRGPTAADLWERLSWWGSGLAAASCLLVLAFHQAAPEPSGFDLLLDMPEVEQTF